MNYLKSFLMVALIFFSVACSSGRINHKGEQAFLDWWGQPHYKESAVSHFKNWTVADKTNKIDVPTNTENRTLKMFSVLKWDHNEWFLALTQDHPTCDKQLAWIIQMPENIWASLDPELSYELCSAPIGTVKYSSVTESSVNFYWCEDSSQPIIELLTNGPACTSHYLYIWNASDRTYRYYGKKCV
jgi:hypothetical protein